VLTICCACIDTVDVVDAAADGILLDDSHAHDDCLLGEEEADVSDESNVWSR
jgi:hypothetical protein